MIKIKQHDITDCGAACLASIASHYKLKLPVSRIRQLAGTDKKGTNVLGLIKAAEKMGFTAKGVKGGVDALPKIPLPAIAHVVVKEVLQHYVVIYKVAKEQVEYMDPGDGQMHKVSIVEFEKQWTGVLVLLAPNDDFIARNEKVSNFSRFVFLIKPHKSILVQALLGAILYTVLGLSTSIYIQKITDYVLVDGNTNLLNLLSVGMLVIIVFQLFIGVAKTILMLRTGQMIDARLILGYYKHLLRLPQRFFDTMRVGEIISRINDAVKIRAFINDTAVNLVVNIFIVFFSFGLMFIYSWKLALIMAIIVPLYVLIYWITNRLNKKQERKVMEHAAELESQLVESLNSVRTIKQFGLEDFTNVKTETRFITLLKTVYKSGINSIFAGNSSEFLSRVFTIVLLWVGSYFVIDQTITPGELLSFYAIIGYFTSPAASLIGMNKTVQNALIAADRLFEIMDLERESDENKIELRKDLIGDLRFENISFSYGTRVDVFEEFNLIIPKGRLTAIIGESGSGKTTLAALIQKLYPLNKGSIYIGKHNINYFNNESLRQLVASVPQKLDLFAGNVVENIAVGEFNPDMEKILAVCNQLGILKFIENLPNGFNTYLGENGASVSGGQKQRLAIARALYRDPEVLVLDEATSSLDSESESYVQRTLDSLKQQGKTIVVIAHRLSTVMNADKIVVLEEGKLIEEGTHYHLFEQQGKYFNMWQKQMPQLKEELEAK
ncbi:peptidase domain-containing ABC transporter [Carboxylicivirga sp. M1479]|uniref:peptidase domain-containing ABC transporter n=1 Tax=Carboxylicivirga sp. M1479 TaxID=2594476 RepID=UPI00117885DC|nr:peptidase domain-containing ABC transporter [Carboxylicivirga sp. M1479]TRX72453.1 peptidase domain-containing ABC transporter [Carboxylicivirga sp. M1479]